MSNAEKLPTEVNEVIETDERSVDYGRIENPDFAQDIADKEAKLRDRGEALDSIEKAVDKHIAYKLGKNAYDNYMMEQGPVEKIFSGDKHASPRGRAAEAIAENQLIGMAQRKFQIENSEAEK